MEGFLILIGINVVIWVIRAAFSAGSVAVNHANNKFKVEVSKGTKDINHEIFEVLKIKAKGQVRNNRSNYYARYTIRLYDVTDVKKNPILSYMDDFQDNNSLAFRFDTNSFIIPYEMAVYDNWVEILDIPTFPLGFPKKGLRKIEVSVEITDDIHILESSTDTIDYNSSEIGYMEINENNMKVEEKIIQTALYVSSSDGDIDFYEKDTILNWIEKSVAGLDYSRKVKKRDRLSKYLEDAEKSINNGIKISSILSDIHDYATEGQKYEIYDLCLKVTSADKVAKKSELEILEEIATLLRLDKTKYKAMQAKELPLEIYEEGAVSPETIIGITGDMDRKSIKRLLMEEYRKWNSRVSHSDPKIREQAENMIVMIAELRKKYR